MKKNIILFFLTILSYTYGFSQVYSPVYSQNSYWFLNSTRRVNFKINNAPYYPIRQQNETTLTDIGTPNGTSGFASASDHCGKLIFVTDGLNIWRYINDSFTKVNQGFTLSGGDLNVSQNVIIVPNPNNQNSFYIVTAGNSGLYYTAYTINDYNENGLGTFDQVNIPLSTSPCSALTSAVYSDTNTHGASFGFNSTNAFYAILFYDRTAKVFKNYFVSASGIGANYMEFGLNNCLSPDTNVTHVKIAPDGNLFAYATEQGQIVSGKFSDSSRSFESNCNAKIQTSGLIRGIEFSPNSQNLYFSSEEYLGKCIINPGNSFFQNYETETFNWLSGVGNLQLADDGKIYGSIYDTIDLMEIRYPDDYSNPYLYGNYAPYINLNIYPTPPPPSYGRVSVPQRVPRREDLPSIRRTPLFNQVAAICQGSSFTLPSVSTNGIPGKWTPELNTNETTTYTFTPGFDQCARTVTMMVAVTPIGQVNQPASQAFCNAAVTVPIVFTTTNTIGTTTYSWSNDNTAIGLPASGTGNIPAFMPVNSGTAPVVATITVSATYYNGNLYCGSGLSKTFTITVNPTAQINQPDSQIACKSGPTSPIVFTTVNTAGTATYSWTNNKSSIGLGAIGNVNPNTNTIPSFTAVNTGTTTVVATITITPIYTNGGKSCAGPSKAFTITVKPTGGQVNQPPSQVVCNGDASTPLAFTTTNTIGTTTYSWTNDTSSVGLPASGNGNAISPFTTLNNGTAQVTATVKVTPIFYDGSMTCTGPLKTFTIKVNPTGQVNQPVSQVVCAGTTASATFTTTITGGTTTYSWTNSNPAIGFAGSGSGNVPAFTDVNAGTVPVATTISVTPTYASGGVSCVGAPKAFTITVNPKGQVNIPGPQVLCKGDIMAPIAITTVNTGITTFAWTNNKTSIGLGASGTGNIPTFTGANTGTAPAVATITVTPTYTAGSKSCIGLAQTFPISVNPKGQVILPTSQVVCNGTATAPVAFTTNTLGTTTYSWTNNNTSIGLGAAGTGNISSFMAVNTGTTPVVATITVTPTFSNGGVNCSGLPQIFTITVNPTGQVNSPVAQVVCNGSTSAPIAFITTNTGGTTTYAWTNSNTSIGLGAAGTGNILAFPAVAGTTPLVATITVIPTYKNGNVNCSGLPQPFNITVKPIVIPSFIEPIISNGSCPALPTTSSNGINGLWEPSTVQEGEHTYAFTPYLGQCTSANPVNVTLTLLQTTTIEANNDNFSSSPFFAPQGGESPSIFTNDYINGVPVSDSDVTASIVSISPNIDPLQLGDCHPMIQFDGSIIVQGRCIFPGTYTITYKITQRFCPSNYAIATATIVIGSSGGSGRMKNNQQSNQNGISETITVFPNPSTGIFNIDLTHVKENYSSIKVYNVLGAVIYEGTLSKSFNQIDLSNVPSGYYVAHISGGESNTTLKLIKN